MHELFICWIYRTTRKEFCWNIIFWRPELGKSFCKMLPIPVTMLWFKNEGFPWVLGNYESLSNKQRRTSKGRARSFHWSKGLHWFPCSQSKQPQVLHCWMATITALESDARTRLSSCNTCTLACELLGECYLCYYCGKSFDLSISYACSWTKIGKRASLERTGCRGSHGSSCVISCVNPPKGGNSTKTSASLLGLEKRICPFSAHFTVLEKKGWYWVDP